MPVTAAVQFLDALCVDLGNGLVVKDEPGVTDPCVLRQWRGRGQWSRGRAPFLRVSLDPRNVMPPLGRAPLHSKGPNLASRLEQHTGGHTTMP